MAPLTGGVATIGNQFKSAAELKIKEVNDAGGIDGRMVELVSYDDKMDPKESANIAQLIAADESILAVIGTYSSSGCYASIPILEAVDCAMITPSASDVNLSKDNTVMYKMWTGFDVYSPQLANFVTKDLGKTKIATIHVYNDWGNGVNQYFTDQAKANGAEIVAEEICYDGDKDFKAQLTNIKAQNPDVLCIFTFYAEGAIITQQAKDLGIECQYVSSGTFVDDQYLSIAGEDCEGMYAINEFVADDPRESVQDFFKRYEELVADGSKPGSYSGNSYDAVGVILQAGQDKGFTRSGINQGLKELSGYVGVTGELSFTNQEVVKPQVIVQVKEGVWSFVKEAE